ncbi:MAG TPA: ABC transporter permease [Acetobacteraceae bacterium]|nr:ABC transporter permease [Acetobacteraceae bacterium]
MDATDRAGFHRLRHIAEVTLWFVGFLAIWQAFVAFGHVSDLILPAPTDFLSRIYINFDRIWPQARSTAALTVIGFLAGALPAVPLGFLIVTVPVMQKTLYPFLVFLNVVPKIALVPLLLVWFGFGGLPKVIVAALLVFFPIMVDTITGFQSLDPRLFHISRSMGATRLQTLWYLRLPTALPYIFSGMKISIVLAVTVVIVSEFVGSNDGLGYLILRATANHDLSLAFAALFVAALIGLALSAFVGLLERLLLPWRATQN